MISGRNGLIQSCLRYFTKGVILSNPKSLFIGFRASSTAEPKPRRLAPVPDEEEECSRWNIENLAATRTWGEIAVKRYTKRSLASSGEKLNAVFSNDGEHRLWISIDGDEPTDEDFAQVWPENKRKTVERLLEVPKDEFVYPEGRYARAFFYKVEEKRGPGGRRFWKELRSGFDEHMRLCGHDTIRDRQIYHLMKEMKLIH